MTITPKYIFLPLSVISGAAGLIAKSLVFSHDCRLRYCEHSLLVIGLGEHGIITSRNTGLFYYAACGLFVASIVAAGLLSMTRRR